MGKVKKTPVEKCLEWIQMVCLSPIAFLVFILIALYKLLRFLSKVTLLFTIVAINTPFAVMYNLSILVFQYYRIGYWSLGHSFWNWSDPRASLGIEVKLFLGDFLKVVAGELLLVIATSIITYFTAPLYVFYITLIVGVIAIFHRWLNSESESKTALSCLCDGLGLSPLMFLFSFIGLFNIGCHPVAKCSFAARRAYLFVTGSPYEPDEEEPDLPDEEEEEHDQLDEEVSKDEQEYYQTLVFEEDSKVSNIRENDRKLGFEEDPKVSNIRENDRKSRKKKGPIKYLASHYPHFDQPIELKNDQVAIVTEDSDTKQYGKESRKVVKETFYGGDIQEVEIKNDQIGIVIEGDVESKDSPKQVPLPQPEMFSFEVPKMEEPKFEDWHLPQMDGRGKVFPDGDRWYKFNEAKISSKQQSVEFPKWNAFERGLFQFNPRIDFIITHHAKKYRFILRTFMVLKLLGVKLCEYPVERLELSEDFSKPKELFNFLVTLSKHDGFVTDKMRGRYEHSLTLSKIVEGVQANEGYKIVHPMDKLFVVAGYTNLQ